MAFLDASLTAFAFAAASPARICALVGRRAGGAGTGGGALEVVTIVLVVTDFVYRSSQNSSFSACHNDMLFFCCGICASFAGFGPGPPGFSTAFCSGRCLRRGMELKLLLVLRIGHLRCLGFST